MCVCVDAPWRVADKGHSSAHLRRAPTLQSSHRVPSLCALPQSGHCPSPALRRCVGSCLQGAAGWGFSAMFSAEALQGSGFPSLQHRGSVFQVVFWLVSFPVVTACLLQRCRELPPVQRKSKTVCCHWPRGQRVTD